MYFILEGKVGIGYYLMTHGLSQDESHHFGIKLEKHNFICDYYVTFNKKSEFICDLLYFFLVYGIWCWEGNEETKTRINCNEVSCLMDKFFLVVNTSSEEEITS